MMKYLLVFLVCAAWISSVQSAWWWPPCYFLSSVTYGFYGTFDDRDPFNNALCKIPQPPDEMGLKLKLFTPSNRAGPISIDYRNPDTILNSPFNQHAPTKFIIHGFTDSSDAEWANGIKDALLEQENMNVILVDWHQGASQSYSQSASNTRLVARMLSFFIRSLKVSGRLDYGSVHLIGHSLGAHTCGQVGSDLDGQIGRITGLDPAGPYFDEDEPLIRLDPTDAKFVDVIHTDSEHLSKLGFGMLRQMGHVDFLPEGGFEQTGCPETIFDTLQKVVEGFSALKETAACSHNRAPRFFMDSINKCQYWASTCSSYEKYNSGYCTCASNNLHCNQMGYHADPNKPGQFYINLHGSEPFCAA